jgi:hypothetical protein
MVHDTRLGNVSASESRAVYTSDRAVTRVSVVVSLVSRTEEVLRQ